MKPLDLTIYPKVELADDWLPRDRLKWAAHREKERQAARAKRLTEAELCAEFEAARCDYLVMQHTGSVWTPLRETWPMNPHDTGNRVGTLLRFASSPHYFEEAA